MQCILQLLQGGEPLAETSTYLNGTIPHRHSSVVALALALALLLPSATLIVLRGSKDGMASEGPLQSGTH